MAGGGVCGHGLGEEDEEGSHCQGRERGTQVGVGCQYIQMGLSVNIRSHTGESPSVYC